MKIAFVLSQYGYAEPFGVMHLSTMARRKDADVRLFSLTEDDADSIAAYRPDVLAFSALTSHVHELLTVNREIRKRHAAVSIMGGPHPTFFPEVVRDPDLDLICVGEGEHAFSEFLDNLDQPSRWDTIRNLTITPRVPDLHPLIVDYDEIGFPDRELVYSNPRMARQKMKSFYSSRGCPFQCTYCMNHAFNSLYKGRGPVVRRRRVAALIEEIVWVKKQWGMEFIRFNDDCFALTADNWLEEFSREYRKKVGLPFWAQVRVDTLSEDILRLLKEAGGYTLGTSIETGNLRVRKEILRRGSATNERISRGYSLAKQYGFRIQANCMLALPGTTPKDDFDSIEFMVKNRIDLIGTTIFHPMLGTEIFRRCAADNLLDNPDSSGFSATTWEASPLNCFSKREKLIQVGLSRISCLVGLFPPIRKILYRLAWHSGAVLDFFLFFFRNLAWKRIIPIRMGIRDVIDFTVATWTLFFPKKKNLAGEEQKS